MAPDGRVVDIATQETVDGRGGQEGDVFATVVPAGQTGFAGIADDVGLDGNAVADFEMGDIGGHGNDLACRFVAQDMVSGDNHRADTAIVPEVDVRSKEPVVSLGHHLRQA